jgi:hypothetical protein
MPDRAIRHCSRAEKAAVQDAQSRVPIELRQSRPVAESIHGSALRGLPKVLGGYSGSIVDGIGYPGFFIFTTLIGVPVLLLVWLAGRRLKLTSPSG